jgi:hypothetical protein
VSTKLINVVSVGFTCNENHVLPAADEAVRINMDKIWFY